MAVSYNDLLGIGILFVTLGIALTYGVDIMTDVRDDVSGDAELTINQSITAVSNVSEKSGTLTTVLMAAIIIGTLIGAFAFGRASN